MKTEGVNPRSVADTKAVALEVNNGKGGFYRFTAEEVETMKSEILAYTHNDGSAWWLGQLLNIEADPFATNKVKQEAGYRKKALYNALTTCFYMPNWLEDVGTLARREPQDEHFARINESDGSIIPDGEPVKYDHGYAIPHPMDNEKAAEVCTLKVKVYRDRESFPDREITKFVANGERVARISPDTYNVGKWCAMMGLSFNTKDNMNYADAVEFVRRKIEDDLQKYGIKVEFVEQ